jgi:hypothetical protein
MALRAPALFVPRSELVAAAVLALSGFGLSAYLFFPGIATHDALAVYDQAHAWSFGDWQPPLLGIIWVALEPIFGFGPGAILLPVLACYWLGIFFFFVALRRMGARTAWLIFVVAVLPPVFAPLGIIWRDVIFAVLWLLACALATLKAGRTGLLRIGLTSVAVLLVLVGYWLRPNSLFAATPLLVYVVWARDWSWIRFLVASIPIIIALQTSTFLINYVWLDARRDHVVHSVLVFDLAGITHFSGENVFPIDDWTPEQVETVKTTCYQPSYWDAIWWHGCEFAINRLDRDDPPGTKLFGSQRLADAWLEAIEAHPLAYLRHRLAYFSALMTGKMMVLFDQYNSGQYRFLFIKSTPYSYLEWGTVWLDSHTPLFRGITWLLLNLIAFLIALRMRNGHHKAAALTLSASGTIFILTYLPAGVAAEFRYIYWSVLASLAAWVVLIARRETLWRARRKNHI